MEQHCCVAPSQELEPPSDEYSYQEALSMGESALQTLHDPGPRELA